MMEARAAGAEDPELGEMERTVQRRLGPAYDGWRGLVEGC
jgi:hypothetical protein